MKMIIFSILLILLISGCVEEIPETTTTIITTTTTLEETTTTLIETTTTLEEIENTTTTIPKRCRFLNFQIKSHLYRNDKLTLYFNNIGSEQINNFEVHLYFDNKTLIESYTNQVIEYRSIKIYEWDVGPGLDNVTFVETDCGKSYSIKV